MNDSTLENHIRSLEERLLTNDVRTSAEQLENLLHEKFFEIGSSGKTYTKEDVKLLLPASTSPTVNIALTDFKIIPLASDVILATYRSYRNNDRMHSLRSSIWKLHENQWKIIFHQGTPITGL